ncbi:hypothetical protein O77CONTIG1_03504 [Leptolyngbya sp. O-77]|nr:hypothetical protein O77CONTIG1_03504 [Leptolyngbya sp. O-77]
MSRNGLRLGPGRRRPLRLLLNTTKFGAKVWSAAGAASGAGLAAGAAAGAGAAGALPLDVISVVGGATAATAAAGAGAAAGTSVVAGAAATGAAGAALLEGSASRKYSEDLPKPSSLPSPLNNENSPPSSFLIKPIVAIAPRNASVCSMRLGVRKSFFRPENAGKPYILSLVI